MRRGVSLGSSTWLSLGLRLGLGLWLGSGLELGLGLGLGFEKRSEPRQLNVAETKQVCTLCTWYMKGLKYIGRVNRVLTRVHRATG